MSDTTDVATQGLVESSRADAIMADLRAWEVKLQRIHGTVTNETVVCMRWGDLKLTMFALWSALIQLDATNATAVTAAHPRGGE